MANCPKCGLPVFHGPAGYAGDACKCFWQSQPAQATEIDTLRVRIAALEAKLKVAEAELTYFKFRGATPEQKAYAMEALAKIKEAS